MNEIQRIKEQFINKLPEGEPSAYQLALLIEEHVQELDALERHNPFQAGCPKTLQRPTLAKNAGVANE
jgi:hypothetical protein